MNDTTANLISKIEQHKEEMKNFLIEICSIPALGPMNGGGGENEKSMKISEIVKSWDKNNRLKFEWLNAEDKKAKHGVRTNLIITYPGKSERNLWVIAHTDIVPVGEREKWSVDPFKPEYKNGKLIGRGVEDNGQAICASLFALKVLLDEDIYPKYTIKIALVADEETNSTYGIRYLIAQNLFSKEDLFLVPDRGSKNGLEIEVAEKSILWVRFVTHGKQVHGSMPHTGVNAFTTAMKFYLALEKELSKKFAKRNKLFEPRFSTFEPTKKEPNIENINTIPGKDVFYMDCRILPIYKVDDVLKSMKKVSSKIAKKMGAKIELEIVYREDAAPPTPENAEIVTLLKKAIKTIRKKEPYVVGVGGGTCAAFLRKIGCHVAVSEKTEQTAHAPDEYVLLDNVVSDAKVYAILFSEQ